MAEASPNAEKSRDNDDDDDNEGLRFRAENATTCRDLIEEARTATAMRGFAAEVMVKLGIEGLEERKVVVDAANAILKIVSVITCQ